MTYPDFALEAAVAEIEAHLQQAGWDAPPMLFALVDGARLAVQDPQLAGRLGIAGTAGTLIPVAQEELPDRPLDEVLAGISWPGEVAGCALSQEIVVLPPSAERELADADADDTSGRDHPVLTAVTHPQRREARLVAGALRGGRTAVVLRLRAGPGDEGDGDLLTGAELAPNLVAALLSTLD